MEPCFVLWLFPVVICSLLSGGRISKELILCCSFVFMYICRLVCAREKKALGQRVMRLCLI